MTRTMETIALNFALERTPNMREDNVESLVAMAPCNHSPIPKTVTKGGRTETWVECYKCGKVLTPQRSGIAPPEPWNAWAAFGRHPA